MRLAAALTLVVAIVGCGGDEETAPAAWCNNTGQLIYLLDQHSTRESCPDGWEGPEPVLGLAMPEVMGRRE